MSVVVLYWGLPDDLSARTPDANRGSLGGGVSVSESSDVGPLCTTKMTIITPPSLQTRLSLEGDPCDAFVCIDSVGGRMPQVWAFPRCHPWTLRNAWPRTASGEMTPIATTHWDFWVPPGISLACAEEEFNIKTSNRRLALRVSRNSTTGQGNVLEHVEPSRSAHLWSES
jgi:hypothetical protein